MKMQLSTSTGRDLSFELIIKKINFEDIVINVDATRAACASCKMYGKRCLKDIAPMSRFDGKYENNYLIILKIPARTWPSKKVLAMSNRGTRILYSSTFCEVVIKSVEKKITRYLSNQGMKVCPSSYCTICPKCQYTQTGTCLHPDKRTYSMELLGVLVSETLENSGLEKLDWFSYKDNYIPEYVSKVTLAMSNSKLQVDYLLSDLLSNKNLRLLG